MLLFNGYGSFSQERLKLIEKTIGINFPQSFLGLLQNNDDGIPEKDVFKYVDKNKGDLRENCVGAFLCINSNQYGDVLSTYQNPPEFFPDGLVAFAEDGGGNLICFDYREGKDNPNPQIVFWNHGADIGKDVSFIAKNFQAFIEMLKADELA